MAIRSYELLINSLVRPFTVASAKTATKFYAVKHSGADDAIEKAAAVGDDTIGISQDTGTAGQVCRVALYGAGVSKCVVGAAGIARGEFAKWAAGGGVGATIGGGTTKLVVWGQALQTGVSADNVALNLGMAAPTVGS